MPLGTQFYKFQPPSLSGQTPHPKIQTFYSFIISLLLFSSCDHFYVATNMKE